MHYEISQTTNVKLMSKIIQTRSLEKEMIDEPFYIVNVDHLLQSYERWVDYLPYIHPFYAVKCNSNPVLLRILCDLGCNFDCASQSEMELIMNLTKDPTRIIFANPCKFISHLHYAKDRNIDLMTFDSEEELYKIYKYYPDAKPLLRIVVDDVPSITSFNIKFGCPLSKVEKLFQLSKELNIPICGFCFHVGSGCSNPQAYKKALMECKKYYLLAKEYNIMISIIDIGGGFWGVDNPHFYFFEYAKVIQESLEELFLEEIQNETIYFIAEPGRYFAQNTHTLVCNVINKKIEETHNEFGENEKLIKYYLNDGIYGSFNCILTDHAKIKFMLLKDGDVDVDVDVDEEPILYKSMIFGPTCDSYDIITQKDTILLPEMQCSDYLYIENFGAYTISSSSSFNGFKVKDFYYIYNNEIHIHNV